MKIKKFTGKIIKIIDLSPTAKEVIIRTSVPVDFIPGSFLNVFMTIDGEKVRRAFSISSSHLEQSEISLTIRLSPQGKMSPLFWKKDLTHTELELMGPLGLNTTDKMLKKKIYLFAFGVGIGVVKSIADYFNTKNDIQKIVIVTGSKFEEEVLYKNYFSKLQKQSSKITVKHVVSRPTPESNYLRGYIQDHVAEFDFNNSDIYVCGQEQACLDLVDKIKSKNPQGCEFFIEGFH